MRNPWRSVLFGAVVHPIFFVVASYNGTSATVTDCNETNLRSAVAGGGTVTLACDGTIVLSQTLVIDRNTVIDASGHDATLSGSNSVRMFVVSSNISLSLIGLRLSNGSAEAGGAILNDAGTVNLLGCVFAQNNAFGTNGIPPSAAGPGYGGAILNRAGIVVATSCTFSNNQARGGTGGAFSGFGYCGGEAHGGAVYSDNGRVSFTNCQFIANTALGGHGGAGFNFGNGCGANASGGAISCVGGMINTVSCTLSNNSVVGGNGNSGPFLGSTGGNAGGGAVSVTQAQIFASFCSFQKNSSVGGLGGRLAMGGLARGGAIHSVSTVMDLGDTFFGNNEAIAGYGNSSSLAAAGQGGAMFASGTATVARVFFSTNVALGAASPTRPGSGPGGLGEGGALYNNGLIHILSSSFLGSWCQGGRGSIKEGSSPPVPTFGNGGDAGGGALYNAGAMHILNSTLAFNQSLGGVRAGGGAIMGCRVSDGAPESSTRARCKSSTPPFLPMRLTLAAACGLAGSAPQRIQSLRSTIKAIALARSLMAGITCPRTRAVSSLRRAVRTMSIRSLARWTTTAARHRCSSWASRALPSTERMRLRLRRSISEASRGLSVHIPTLVLWRCESLKPPLSPLSEKQRHKQFRFESSVMPTLRIGFFLRPASGRGRLWQQT